MKHTKEPWRTASNILVISNEGYRSICNCGGKVGFDRSEDEESKANAKRIVDCVNFCAGVSELPLKGLENLITAAQIALERLRDENKLRYRDSEWESVMVLREALEVAKPLEKLFKAHATMSNGCGTWSFGQTEEEAVGKVHNIAGRLGLLVVGDIEVKEIILGDESNSH